MLLTSFKKSAVIFSSAAEYNCNADYTVAEDFCMQKNTVLKAVLIISILVLAACSKAPSLSTEDIAAAYSGDFACSAAILAEDDRFSVDIEKSGGKIVFTVTEPESMAGLCAVFDGAAAEFSFGEISAAFSFGDIPAAAPAKLFYGAAQALSLPDGISLNIEQTRAVARCDGFSAELDKSGLALVRLSFPEQNTVFEIENFRFIEKS